MTSIKDVESTALAVQPSGELSGEGSLTLNNNSSLPLNPFARKLPSVEDGVTSASESGISNGVAKGSAPEISGVAESDEMEVSNEEVCYHYLQTMPAAEFHSFINRNVSMGTITLSSTDPVGVHHVYYPWEDFLGDNIMTDKLRNYKLIRGTLIVTGIVTAPPAAYGAAVVTGVCDVDTAGTVIPLGPTMDRTQVFQGPHHLVDWATSTNFEIRLPFSWPTEWGDRVLNDIGRMWSLVVYNLVSPDTTLDSGCDKCNIRFFCRSEDLEVAYPIYQSGFEKFRRQANQASIDRFGAIPSRLASAGSWMAYYVSTVFPVVAPLTVPVGTVLGKASEVLDYFGFTRNQRVSPAIAVVPKFLHNLVNVDVPDTSEVVALSGHNAISVDPILAGAANSVDTSSFASIMQHWALMGSFEWSTANATGTGLYSFPVTPYVTAGNYTTAAGYAGLPFSKWRGGMEYLIYIPVSTLHRGAIQFLFTSLENSAGYEPTTTSFNYIADVAAGKIFHINVGYMAEYPAQPSVYTPFDLSTVVIKPDMGFGKIIVRVINPIVGGPSCTTTVTAFVFARAASDMKFGACTGTVQSYDVNGFHSTTLQQVTYQSGLALGDGPNQVEKIDLVSTAGEYPADAALWGETIESGRAMAQKFWPMRQTLTALSVSLAATSFDHSPGGVPLFSFLKHYTLLYSLWAGSIRVKMMRLPSVDTVAPPGLCVSKTVRGGSAPSGVSDFYTQSTFQKVDGVFAEVQFPFYSDCTALNPRGTSDLQDWIGFVANGDTVSNYVYLMYAGGPDMRFGRFRRVPGDRKSVV